MAKDPDKSSSDFDDELRKLPQTVMLIKTKESKKPTGRGRKKRKLMANNDSMPVRFILRVSPTEQIKDCGFENCPWGRFFETFYLTICSENFEVSFGKGRGYLIFTIKYAISESIELTGDINVDLCEDFVNESNCEFKEDIIFSMFQSAIYANKQKQQRSQFINNNGNNNNSNSSNDNSNSNSNSSNDNNNEDDIVIPQFQVSSLTQNVQNNNTNDEEEDDDVNNDEKSNSRRRYIGDLNDIKHQCLQLKKRNKMLEKENASLKQDIRALHASIKNGNIGPGSLSSGMRDFGAGFGNNDNLVGINDNSSKSLKRAPKRRADRSFLNPRRKKNRKGGFSFANDPADKK